jgi:copper chaperone CopZ
MASVAETVQVSGIRCERCVGRLAGVLAGHEGLESANATLMGQVTLVWDDAQTNREALLEAMAARRLPRGRDRLVAGIRRLVAGIRAPLRALKTQG